MNFTRRKVRGRTQKTYKEWHDADGLGYRITWSNQRYGLPAVYYACVRVVRLRDGFQWWDFCQHRRPYKTLKAATDACERNRKIWTAFLELGQASGRRSERLSELAARGKQGGGNILATVPVWAYPHCDPVLLRMQFPEGKRCNEQDLDDPSPTSTNSESDTATPGATSSEKTPTSGPASIAAEEAGITTPMTETQSKATSSPRSTRAKVAAAPGEAGKKPSRKRTPRSSTAGEPTSKSSKSRKRSVKADSQN